ncbi:MAG TPA: glutaredoxin domain-containing protein [Candidatus Dojkabacteria bacterium]|nr:glutaredoxin domain-containing protein [Candidatus Dojkabacteria bacterium]
MNIAYFRKSKHSLEETIKNVKELATKNGWNNLGEVKLKDKGQMLLVCKEDWVNDLLEEEHNLLGFMPCAISVFKKGDDVMVGTGQPAVIKALARTAVAAQMATQAEEEVKKLIHEAAGVEELKVKKVKLYSTTTCPYCKMEKNWLDEKGVKYEQVLVDQNQQAAEEMVQATGQMGVPVTALEFEEGESEFVVGFDRNKLSALLGVK